MSPQKYDCIIIGAGPIGLSTAISASKFNLNYMVLEKGILVNSIFNYPNQMTFFSTGPEIEIGNIPLTAAQPKPTRAEALQYYRRVADYFELNIRYHSMVKKIEKTQSGFDILLQDGEKLWASNIVLATGIYDNPNPLDIPGENLAKVSHYYNESHYYYKNKVVIVGGRNSAIEAALEIYRAGGEVTLVHRNEWFDDDVKYWLLPDIENRIGRDEVSVYFNSRLIRIEQKTVTIIVKEKEKIIIDNDAVLALIGYHPDFSLITSFGVMVDKKTLVPQHNPKTFETNIKGLYIAGSLTVGSNANRIFIFNGREHAEKIVSSIVAATDNKAGSKL